MIHMSDLQHQNSRQLIFAALISLFLSCVITWPVCFSPQSLLIGHPGNDTWNHVWGYWWVGEALSRGEWPISAQELVYPQGGSLYFIDTMQALFSFPLQLLFGPVFAYNFVIILQISFCGFSAWLLARRLTGDHYAAIGALIIYQFSPHLLGQAYNGISETLCAGWFPLTLWALFRLLDRPTWKSALWLW